MKSKRFGGKRCASDMAAFSLQAKMTLKELQALARNVGQPINTVELSQIREVRRTLKNQECLELFLRQDKALHLFVCRKLFVLL